MAQTTYPHDPTLDLVLERIVDVPVEKVWKAWTTPEQLKQWFTPAPWTTTDCEIDLRPGGAFRTVIRSPEGSEKTANCCYLEVVENQKLVWTDAMGPGFRPAPKPNQCFGHFFTAVILLEPHGAGTRYTVIALHGDQAAAQADLEQGFNFGWSAALEQMVGLIKSGAF